MKEILQNPVYLSSRNIKGIEGRWLSYPYLLYIALILALPSLLLRLMGICSCTVFALAGLAIIALSTLLIGTQALFSISRERENKTFDSLRLTSLSASDVITGKLYPEFLALLRLLAFAAPTIILLGGTSEYGIGGGIAVLWISLLSGIFSLLAGFVLSSLCRTTSQAVIMGITLKLAWLLAAPLLDMVMAALFISRTPPPFFSSINPLVALYSILLPEGMKGLWVLLPWSFFSLTPIALFALWHAAEKIYDRGGPQWVYGQRKAHGLFVHGWGPGWLKEAHPAFSRWLSNPAFLKEISLQMLRGAGRLPGYLVFIALFMAPYLYARSWGIAETVNPHRKGAPSAAVVSLPRNFAGGQGAQEGGKRPVIRTQRGNFFTLQGHTLVGCMRWTMYRALGIPLPARLVKERSFRSSHDSWRQGDEGLTSSLTAAKKELTVPLTRNDVQRLDSQAMRWGLLGALWLLLFYIAIRGCCFTASSVTGEKERRTWEDLALSGLSPGDLLSGKLTGALIMPAIQMTVVFPMLLFFTFSDNLTIIEVISVYLYSLALLITSAMLGLWASATSKTTHDAHGKALGIVLICMFLVPLASPFLWCAALMAFPVLLILIVAERHDKRLFIAYSGISLALVLSLFSASPLTAPLTFLPTVVPDVSRLSLLGFFGPAVDSIFHCAMSLLLLGGLSYVLWNKALKAVSAKSEPSAMRVDEERNMGTIRPLLNAP
jgi:hypothetical protein